MAGDDEPRGAAPGAFASARDRPAFWPLLLFGFFALVDLATYRAALQGPFVSDDIGYIVTSPYTRDLSVESIRGMFDPSGAARLYTANYAPVHLLLTAVERNIFAGDVLGYHLVNVAVHAVASVLVVMLLLRSRLPAAGALLGGLIFSVHPANVEAVAWITQLKTNGSLALALGALLALGSHPLAATVLFAAALGTKASALFALPMAAVSAWCSGFAAGRHSGRWLLVWTLLAAVYAIPQFGSFAAVGAVEVADFQDPWIHLRSLAAYAARYAVMAVTSWGVSAFHEPGPAVSLLDPWWLAAIPLAVLLLWRLWVAFRRRSEEAAYWVGAAAAYAPVSQILPFAIPMADRYLYTALPGLIGATIFVVRDALDRWNAGARLRRGVAIGAALLAVLFAFHSAARARLWANETRLYLDAARHYPDGGTAAFFAARRAAQEGDAAAAVAALRRAADRGVDRFMVLRDDPALAPVRDDPAFQELLRELAGLWIERVSRRDGLTAPDLRVMAHAHIVREEYDRAEELLGQAAELGGPLEPVIRQELAALRARRAATPGGSPRE